MRHPARTAPLAAVLVLLAACGGTDGQQVVSQQTPAKAVAAAAAKSTSAASQRTKMTTELDGDEVVRMDTISSADGSKLRGTMRIEGAGRIEFLHVDGASYYEFPGLPEGVTWVKMTDDDLKAMGIDLGAAQQQSGANALALLSATADVTTVGADRVNGVDATHYRATIDQRKSAAANGVISGQVLEQSIGLLGETFVADLWIGTDGFVRRIEYSADLAKAPKLPKGLPATGRIAYRFDLEGYGDEVQVEAPDPAEVIDYAEVRQATGGSGTN